MKVRRLDEAAAIEVHAAAAFGSRVFGNDTVAHDTPLDKIDTTTPAVMHARGGLVGSVTVFYGKPVEHCFMVERNGCAITVEPFYGKPHDMVHIGGKGGRITLVLIAPLERGGIAAEQVARQNSLVLELPAVTVAFAHGTVRRIFDILAAGFFSAGRETAVEGDTGRHLEGRKERAAPLGRLGGRIGSLGNEYFAAFGDAVGRHILGQFVDSVLQVIPGLVPTAAVIGVSAVFHIDIAAQLITGLLLCRNRRRQ